ncbi:hypothetical protein [Streptomyces sp. NPDC127108]|uniref:hypothetical protein n=1 Tax=Streptomyces sp. NPDC127108 TaxID=3345361 RepID=UPI00364111A4
MTDGWAEGALDAVLGRVAVTLAEVGPRFPLSADPDTGTWTTTRRGSWTGGFWAGLLWLRARYTGAPADRTAAEACTARLADWADADTATRGLILWYGTASATGSEAATALRARAARACLTAFDPELGLVPWGSAFGGPRLLARADGAPGLVPLLASAGPRGREAAASHLRRHLELCVGDGGKLAPAWRHDPTTGWHPLTEPAPGWSRGRAWLLLAVADALTRPGGAVANPDHLRATARWLGAPGPGPAGAAACPATVAETARPASSGGAVRPTSPGGTARPASPGGTARPTSPEGTVRPASPGGTVRPASPRAAARSTPLGPTGHLAALGDEPLPAPLADAPHPTPLGDTPRLTSRAAAPLPTSRAAVPRPASRADVPCPTSRAAVPRPASRVDAPRPASRAAVPRPASRVDAPRPTSPADAPQPTSPADVPRPTPPADAPLPTPPADAPRPTPPADAPLPTPPPPPATTPSTSPTQAPPPATPLIPPADESHPDGPSDTSAAAITAVALLKLATLPGEEVCARRAEAILHRLVTAHLSGTGSATDTGANTGTGTGTNTGTGGTNSGTGPGPGTETGTNPGTGKALSALTIPTALTTPPVRPPGMLLHGCHDATTGTAVQHELIWGDFFLALGLAALTGLVDPREA